LNGNTVLMVGKTLEGQRGGGSRKIKGRGLGGKEGIHRGGKDCEGSLRLNSEEEVVAGGDGEGKRKAHCKGSKKGWGKDAFWPDKRVRRQPRTWGNRRKTKRGWGAKILRMGAKSAKPARERTPRKGQPSRRKGKKMSKEFQGHARKFKNSWGDKRGKRLRGAKSQGTYKLGDAGLKNFAAANRGCNKRTAKRFLEGGAKRKNSRGTFIRRLR